MDAEAIISVQDDFLEKADLLKEQIKNEFIKTDPKMEIVIEEEEKCEFFICKEKSK